MVGKRVQFDDETWEAIEAVAYRTGRSFQELVDEAFADLLKKHKQPVGPVGRQFSLLGTTSFPRTKALFQASGQGCGLLPRLLPNLEN
jgi:hypothetical protein